MLTGICAECSYAIFLKLASNNPWPALTATHKLESPSFSFYDLIQSQVRAEGWRPALYQHWTLGGQLINPQTSHSPFSQRQGLPGNICWRLGLVRQDVTWWQSPRVQIQRGRDGFYPLGSALLPRFPRVGRDTARPGGLRASLLLDWEILGLVLDGAAGALLHVGLLPHLDLLVLRDWFLL